MKTAVPMLAALLALAGCGQAAETAAQNAAPTVRLPVLPGRPGAAYFEIDVPADHGALVAVTSPQAGRIEMHETMRQGTMSGMRPVERIAPENGRIVFRQGGRHLMLHEIDPRLQAGGRAQLALRFEHGQTRMLEAQVVEPGDADAGH